MILLLFVLLLGCAGGSEGTDAAPPIQPPPPQAAPVPEPTPPMPAMKTLQVAGTIATGGTFSGTVVYDPEQAPINTNVRGLAPNEVLAIQAYRITLNPKYLFLPATIIFDGTLPDQTVEFCRGRCVFGGG